MKLHIYILGVISVAMLLLGSCSAEPFENIPASSNGTAEEDDGMVDVTVSFAVEDFENYATRVDGEEGEEGEEGSDEGDEDEVSDDLPNIDLLVYALRDDKGNVLYQYGKGIVDTWSTDEDGNAVLPPALQENNYTVTDDNNQTLMKVKWEKSKTTGKYEMTTPITLRVMRGTVFHLSCWAQSSQCIAYDFNHLTDVRVDYSKMKINDESYDAFCATSIFSVGQVDATITVTLTRPFAQINVGVLQSDKDDDNLLTGENKYKYSQITLKGVCTSFNVVENKVNTKTDNSKADDSGTDASEDDDTVTLGFSLLSFDEEDKPTTFEVKVWGSTAESNQWAMVSKTYQHLAMCYVLVPEASYETDEDGKFKDDDAAATPKNDPDDTQKDYEVEDGVISPSVNPSTIKLVSFSLAKDEKGGDAKTYTPQDDEKATISVKRNWRTNLLFDDWSWGDTTQ